MVLFSPCTPADVDKLAVSGRQGSSLSSGACSEGTVCSDTSCVHHETLGGLRALSSSCPVQMEWTEKLATCLSLAGEGGCLFS